MKIFGILLLVFISFTIEAQLFTFRNINHKNGLILSSVTAIAQDKYDYIWIGTDGAGLQRFDGKNLKSIRVENEENEHHVTSIDPDNNRIYFSSRYFGFFCYSRGKYEQFLSEDLQFGEHLQIVKNQEYLYLIGSKKMLVIRDNKVVKSYFFKRNLQTIKQALEFPQGLLILSDEGSYLVKGDKISHLALLLNPEKNYVIDAARQVNQDLILYDFKKNISIRFNPDKGYDRQLNFQSLKHTVSHKIQQTYNRGDQLLLLDSANNLYYFKNNGFSYIPKNSMNNRSVFQKPFIDDNGDFWIGTVNAGVFKISLEPFTKIDLHPVYRDPLISFIFRSEQNEVVLSNFNGETRIGSFKSNDFETLNLRIYGHTQFQQIHYFATNKGIYMLRDGKLKAVESIAGNGKINFIYSSKNALYYSPEGKGLMIYQKGKSEILIPAFIVSHFYTAETNEAAGKIYFGTNDGIYDYDMKNGHVNSLKSTFKSGDYCGVSATDSYGTCWFSYGKFLVGITKNGQPVIIRDKKYFKSTIFYTLNADDFGNIIVGTNVGLTKFKVTRKGEVSKIFHYNAENGFEGFETHMRSHFKTGNFIFIGTIEGLFAINTQILEKTPAPQKPMIFQDKNKQQVSDDPIIQVNYSVINPKMKGIYYSYRLKGKNDEWSELTTRNEAIFANIGDEDYIFEVKATYDGVNFSPVSSLRITKYLPFWKSKWFILMLILSIALANIIVLDRSKNFELSQIIENQSIEINHRIRSVLLIFAFISNTASHFVVGQVEKNMPDLNVLNISVAFVLFLLFLMSISKTRFHQSKKYLLHIALLAILFQCYLGTYLSSIHPLYVVIICLCTAVIPFILNKIYEVVLLAILQIVSAAAISFLIEDAQYNEILFLIAIFVSVSLSLFTTYIRNESMQKLIFTSGIINQGNIFAIAFNSSNHITFISENSYETLRISSGALLGKHISELNVFINTDFLKRKIDFTSAFQFDQKSIIPMLKPDGNVIWMEWSCKVFSKSIKVIFGQDISDRVAIESTYESLVENADDLIYFVDVSGKFMFTNNKFREKLGYTSEELLQRDSVNFASEHAVDQVRSFYEKQFRNKTLNSYFEFPVRHKDGHEIWVGQNTTLLYAAGSDKIIKGFLSLARDITEKRQQQQLIETQHSNITASITYAKKIQQNLLPPKKRFDHLFSEYACCYMPRDIVSGDFFWLEEIEGKIVLVLSDCTGHGVPGAFMTLLGINLLNQIIAEDLILDPGTILTKLDEKLLQILPHSENSTVLDGMELSLVVIDKTEGVLRYACAGGKFISIQAEGTVIHRGESKHIGDLPELNFSSYHTYSMQLQDVKSLFFFSDGVTDQFCEGSNKKFSVKKLLEILNKNTTLSAEQQVNLVRDKLLAWQGEARQMDDITFLSVRI